MAKAQPNQNGLSAVETREIQTPVVQEEKKEPVIETEDLSESVNQSAYVEMGKTYESPMGKGEPLLGQCQPLFGGDQKSAQYTFGTNDMRPEADRKLPHHQRILAFIESRHTGDFIKLNDFLKSLYPLPKPNEKPAWQNQGVMRKLRQDLLAMRDRGEIVFSNMNPERLGDNYHVGEQRLRRDYNIGDLNIEAKLAY